ncbi:MAG: hypothetical protein AAFX44_06705 [Pseudomonadota bacterium]
MSAISKAIAAFLSSLVALLAALGVNVPDGLTAELIAEAVGIAFVIFGVVWASPKNEE